MNRSALLALAVLVLPACTAATAETTGAAGESALGASAPIALSGAYRFKGEVRPIGRKTVDVIDERMSGAAERLAAVRAEGAACSRVLSTTWRCTKMRAGATVPAPSIAAIAEAHGDAFATFGPTTAPPGLVSEAESLVEWTIFQDGESTGGRFTSYRYLDLQGDLVKIVLPGDVELIVKDADHLAKWASKRVSEGQWRWHEDMALVILER